MQDAKIIGLLNERDEKAIRALESSYGKYLFKIAYNILEDRLDVEEALGDVYLKVWNSIPPNRPDNLKIYLAKLARHSAIDILRKRCRAGKVSVSLDVPADELCDAVSGIADPEDELDGKILGEGINSWLATVQKDRRKVFVLRYFYAEKISDISKNTGMSEGAVKTLLFRLRGELRDYLIRKQLID